MHNNLRWKLCSFAALTVRAARARGRYLFVPRAAVEIRARVGGGVGRKGAAVLAGFFSGPSALAASILC